MRMVRNVENISEKSKMPPQEQNEIIMAIITCSGV
jgi:hypothetical protein